MDAAVAAAFAAFVCELPLCSALGGGALLVSPPSGETLAIDMFARAPGLGLDARERAALDFVGVEVSFGAALQVFHAGRGSAAVPLALPGLLEAHARFGTLPMAEIVAPATELATRGFTVGHGVAFAMQVVGPIARLTPECFSLFSRTDTLPEEGARLDNPSFAAVLDELARRPEETVRALYTDLARALAPSAGGLVTAADVAAARPETHAPVCVTHAGFEIATMPGPSTGGTLVALGARLHEGLRHHGFLTSGHLFEIAGVQEALLALRVPDFDAKVRDPAFVRDLLTDASVARLRAVGEPAVKDNPLGSTTHISAIDEGGLAVALTLTNGEGSGHALPGTGIVVNNLLGEEDIHPHGFHVDPPGRPLTTMMAPTVLRREGEVMALGSGGSNRLRNAILQVLVGVLEHERPLEEAVAAPRLHLQPDPVTRAVRLAIESASLDPEVLAKLLARYPESPMVFPVPNMFFGGVHVARSIRGALEGAGDPRRGGAVAIA